MKYKKEICDVYGERMHPKNKKRFRNYVCSVAKSLDYKCNIESGLLAKNIIIGNPEKAEFVVTAHYDTPPRLPKFFVKHMLFHSLISLPLLFLGFNFLLTQAFLFFNLSINFVNIVFPTINYLICGGLVGYSLGFLGNANKKNYNDNSSGILGILNLMEKYKSDEFKSKICFVLTDNEEKGLLGALYYSRKHKKSLRCQTVINLDCIGNGDQFNLYYCGEKETEIIKSIKELKQEKYKFKSIKSSLLSMSDHIAFRKSNHVCLLSVEQKNNKSLYNQIHSINDTIINENNIDFVVSTLNDVMKKENKFYKKKKIALINKTEKVEELCINK